MVNVQKFQRKTYSENSRLLASVLALRSLVASSAFSDSLSQYSEILHVSKAPSDHHVISMAAAQDGNLNSRHSHTETPKTPKMQNRVSLMD